MGIPPPLNPPRCGYPINLECQYVKKESAVRQANHWKSALADDPVLGPVSGYTIGVGPRKNGLYPLIWVTVRDAGV